MLWQFLWVLKALEKQFNRKNCVKRINGTFFELKLLVKLVYPGKFWNHHLEQLKNKNSKLFTKNKLFIYFCLHFSLFFLIFVSFRDCVTLCKVYIHSPAFNGNLRYPTQVNWKNKFSCSLTTTSKYPYRCACLNEAKFSSEKSGNG